MIPTAGGGRAVVFNDVEVLTQTSPGRESPRKRSYEVFEVSRLFIHYKIGSATEKYQCILFADLLDSIFELLF